MGHAVNYKDLLRGMEGKELSTMPLTLREMAEEAFRPTDTHYRPHPDRAFDLARRHMNAVVLAAAVTPAHQDRLRVELGWYVRFLADIEKEVARLEDERRQLTYLDHAPGCLYPGLLEEVGAIRYSLVPPAPDAA
jgi:hypothetical protein